MRKSAYTILIICEGENTERLFFNSIKDLIISHFYEIGAKVTIRPEPIEKEESKRRKSPNKQERKQKQLKTVVNEPEIIDGRPPLKWVLEGRKELEDGTYNEVWTVFDHDNHPARKEAFEVADKEIEGITEKVRIAFSSISFEYYLLLHFERIYKAFEKSECRYKIENNTRKKGKAKWNNVNCGTNNHHTLDCFGQKCVNGYLRNKGYLTGSTKTNQSVFPLVKDRLSLGFENAAWLRFHSNSLNPKIPNYDRNPYVTTDYLIKRLTGLNETWTWIDIDRWHVFTNLSVYISKEKQIRVMNTGKITEIIPQLSLVEINQQANSRIKMGERVIISPGETQNLIQLEVKSDSWFILRLKDQNIMFEFNTLKLE
jgi:hypothetical protein